MLLILIDNNCRPLNNCSSSEPIHNDGTLTYAQDKRERDGSIMESHPPTGRDVSDVNMTGEKGIREADPEDENELPSDLDSKSTDLSFLKNEAKVTDKITSKNKARGQYKTASYVEGKRGNGPSGFDAFFAHNNALVEGTYVDNNNFNPNDESKGMLANYKPGKQKKITEEDIFRESDYLPQQQNKDWFEVMPEPISVKNRHLINVTRPVGVNTIGTTHKNASYDIRGTPVTPKFVISPFLNSSIEPDINIKGLC